MWIFEYHENVLEQFLCARWYSEHSVPHEMCLEFTPEDDRA